jgi:hypothetical protein
MPFASQAQRRLFHAKEARGEMKPGTAARWQAETGKKHLPERKKKRKRGRSGRR